MNLSTFALVVVGISVFEFTVATGASFSVSTLGVVGVAALYWATHAFALDHRGANTDIAAKKDCATDDLPVFSAALYGRWALPWNSERTL